MQKIEHNSLCETETYKGMTDNEIIKALEKEIHIANDIGGVYSMMIQIEPIKDALDLINRQKAEIERLTNAYKQCAWERDTFLDERNSQIERIRELTRVVYDKEISEAKAEAIKEFAERLKEQFSENKYILPSVNISVDNLVKEMTEVAKSIHRLEVAYELIADIHSQLCRTTARNDDITEDTQEILRKILLLNKKLRGGAEE